MFSMQLSVSLYSADDSLSPGSCHLHGLQAAQIRHLASAMQHGSICVVSLTGKGEGTPSILLDAVVCTGPEGASEAQEEDGVDLVTPPWLCHYLKASPGTRVEIFLQVHTLGSVRYLDHGSTHLEFRYHSHCNYRHWDEVSTGNEGLDNDPGAFQSVGRWHSHESGALGPASVNAAALARMLPLLLGSRSVALASGPPPSSGSIDADYKAMIAVNALDSTILFEVVLERVPVGDENEAQTRAPVDEWEESPAQWTVWRVDQAADIQSLQQLCSIQQHVQPAPQSLQRTPQYDASAPLPTLSPRTTRFLARLLSWAAAAPSHAAKQYCSILLSGSAGSGKTLLMQSFGSQLRDSGHAVFMLTSAMVAAHRGSSSSSSSSSSSAISASVDSSSSDPRKLALRLVSLAGISLPKEHRSSKIMLLLDDVDTFLYALDTENGRGTSGSMYLLGTTDASVLAALQDFSYCLRSLLVSLSKAYLSQGTGDVFVLGSTRRSPAAVYRSADPTTLPRFEHITSLPALQAADREVVLTTRLSSLGHVDTDPAVVRRAAAVCSTYQAADLTRVADTASRMADFHSRSYLLPATTSEDVRGDLKNAAMHEKSCVDKFLLEACVTVSPTGMRDFDSLLSGIGVSTAPPENLSWSDFGGYDASVAGIKRYLRCGRGLRGLVLHGPSGCGKSYLARVIASELRRAHAGTTGAVDATDAAGAPIASVPGDSDSRSPSYNFVSIKSTDLLSKYFGQTEAAVRAVFANARANAPCVLFFDDFEALACKRAMPNSGGNNGAEGVGEGSTHDMEARVLSTFLNELDGVAAGAQSGNVLTWSGEQAVAEESLVVIVACNHLSSLDDALIRPGRLSHHFQLGWPTVTDCARILVKKLEGMPVVIADSSNAVEVHAQTQGQRQDAEVESVFPLEIVSRLALDAIERDTEMTAEGGREEKVDSTPADGDDYRCRGVSGASIALLCQQVVLSAAREAIQRLISSGANTDPAQLDTSSYRVLQRHFDALLPAPAAVPEVKPAPTEAAPAPFVFDGTFTFQREI